MRKGHGGEKKKKKKKGQELGGLPPGLLTFLGLPPLAAHIIQIVVCLTQNKFDYMCPVNFVYPCVRVYGYTVWTNSEKKVPLYFLGQESMWCVLLKAIVPKPMIQAQKMLPDA